MRNPVMPAFVAGLADDACIVAAAGQHERYICGCDEIDFVDRLPGCDVILLRADGEDWDVNIAERDMPSVKLAASFKKIVMQVEAAQIFAVHAIGQTRRVGIPGHQVDHGRPAPQEIFVHNPGPDEVARAQQLKGASHLARIEIALLPHNVFKKAELAVVDEQHELACFGKIGLRRKERR